MNFIYQNDRCSKLDHWSGISVAPRKDDPRIKLMKPDVVLVFHNPVHQQSDDDKQVPLSWFETALRADTERTHNLRRAETLRRSEIHRHRNRARPVSFLSSVQNLSSISLDMNDEDEEYEAADDSGRGVKVWEFRQALLQDICDHMPQKGFDVSVFSSVDNDELFVCIGIRNMRTIKHHLQCYSMKLQLKHEMIQTLQIKQPPDEVESSPPFIRYDRRLAANVFGEGKKDTDVFQNYGAHSGKPVVISGRDRIEIIHRHLTNHINLDYAVEHNLLVQWYPAHAEARIAELQRSWARWSLLTDFTVRQPLSLIHDYFGSRVAFIFAWTGHYAKMLLCLSPVGVLWEILNAIAYFVGNNSLWNRGSVMGFGLAVVIWARLASNSWGREEDFLKILWDLNSVGKDMSRRPEFHGKLEPDPADGNKMHLEYPPWKYTFRTVVSWVITLLFCAFDFLCVVVWLDIYRGKLTIVACGVQAMMVQTFTAIYNWMAEALTLAENHKFQQHFYQSYLKKMFIFQLVNQYSAFFYMAVKQQFTPGGCPGGEDGCVHQIQRTLPMTLSILAALQIAEVFARTLLVKVLLFVEQWQAQSAGESVLVYSYVEQQSKYGRFRVREQIEGMTQLSLTLGYVLIFGCVAPRIVPLCFLIFMIQLRAGGVIMTTAVNRTVPRVTVGLGPWNDIFYFLMGLGVLFSAYLLVQFGPLFKGTVLLTKLTGIFMYCFLVLLIWLCVDLCCPASDSKSQLLEDRRNVVEHCVMRLHEGKNFEATTMGKSYSEGEIIGETAFTQQAVMGDWEAIPKLIPTAEAEEILNSSTEVAEDKAMPMQATSAVKRRPDQV